MFSFQRYLEACLYCLLCMLGRSNLQCKTMMFSLTPTLLIGLNGHINVIKLFLHSVFILHEMVFYTLVTFSHLPSHLPVNSVHFYWLKDGYFYALWAHIVVNFLLIVCSIYLQNFYIDLKILTDITIEFYDFIADALGGTNYYVEATWR
jgi:hypothetical protein